MGSAFAAAPAMPASPWSSAVPASPASVPCRWLTVDARRARKQKEQLGKPHAHPLQLEISFSQRIAALFDRLAVKALTLAMGRARKKLTEDAPNTDHAALKKGLEAENDFTLAEAQALAKEVANQNALQMKRSLRAVRPADDAKSLALKVPELSHDNVLRHAERTVREIQAISVKMADRLAPVVAQAVSQGMRGEDLAQELQARLGIEKKAAQRLAVGQVIRINSAITEERHAALGVTEYIWRSTDDQHTRAWHRKLNKTRQSYDNPPLGGGGGPKDFGNPGSADVCRCQAIPVFPSAEQEAEAAAARAQARAEAKAAAEAQAQAVAEAEASAKAAAEAEAKAKADAEQAAAQAAAEAEATAAKAAEAAAKAAAEAAPAEGPHAAAVQTAAKLAEAATARHAKLAVVASAAKAEERAAVAAAAAATQAAEAARLANAENAAALAEAAVKAKLAAAAKEKAASKASGDANVALHDKDDAEKITKLPPAEQAQRLAQEAAGKAYKAEQAAKAKAKKAAAAALVSPEHKAAAAAEDKAKKAASAEAKAKTAAALEEKARAEAAYAVKDVGPLAAADQRTAALPRTPPQPALGLSGKPASDPKYPSLAEEILATNTRRVFALKAPEVDVLKRYVGSEYEPMRALQGGATPEQVAAKHGVPVEVVKEIQSRLKHLERAQQALSIDEPTKHGSLYRGMAVDHATMHALLDGDEITHGNFSVNSTSYAKHIADAFAVPTLEKPHAVVIKYLKVKNGTPMMFQGNTKNHEQEIALGKGRYRIVSRSFGEKSGFVPADEMRRGLLQITVEEIDEQEDVAAKAAQHAAHAAEDVAEAAAKKAAVAAKAQAAKAAKAEAKAEAAEAAEAKATKAASAAAAKAEKRFLEIKAKFGEETAKRDAAATARAKADKAAAAKEAAAKAAAASPKTPTTPSETKPKAAPVAPPDNLAAGGEQLAQGTRVRFAQRGPENPISKSISKALDRVGFKAMFAKTPGHLQFTDKVVDIDPSGAGAARMKGWRANLEKNEVTSLTQGLHSADLQLIRVSTRAEDYIGLSKALVHEVDTTKRIPKADFQGYMRMIPTNVPHSTRGTATSAEQDAAMIAVHEFGHAVHLNDANAKTAFHADEIVRKVFADPQREAVSLYGDENHKEFFAEAFTAYWHYTPGWMKRNAPKMHKMVEDVLRLRKMPLNPAA